MWNKAQSLQQEWNKAKKQQLELQKNPNSPEAKAMQRRIGIALFILGVLGIPANIYIYYATGRIWLIGITLLSGLILGPYTSFVKGR